LSEPTTDLRFPEAMRTRAWAHKTLNTQLASWTELRHDTVLYARQSSTPLILCFYPAGFVEPRPEFWRRMNLLASSAGSLPAAMPPFGIVQVESRDSPGRFITADLASIQSKRQAFFQRFADTMSTLQSLSEKELARQPFSASDIAFLRNLIQATDSAY